MCCSTAIFRNWQLSWSAFCEHQARENVEAPLTEKELLMKEEAKLDIATSGTKGQCGR